MKKVSTLCVTLALAAVMLTACLSCYKQPEPFWPPAGQASEVNTDLATITFIGETEDVKLYLVERERCEYILAVSKYRQYSVAITNR